MKINVYRTAPGKERKARVELARAGIKSLLPLEQRSRRGRKGKDILHRVPTAPGYIFADAKPPESNYVRTRVGGVVRAEIGALYGRKRLPRPQPERMWHRGDRVTVSLATGDKTGTVTDVRRRILLVELDGSRVSTSVGVKKVRLSAADKEKPRR